ncbi:type VI secretion system-associated FHA domain protein TagH [Celerinatantimonas sp. MCCC 1A17872]|uniref:type VI secretion system-associated FHA domain protein TagH n=1 Tax=Celerinatantimonas sp. MCCC 1A17872 TaxID=3177514 RepID=UPI0038CB7983
MMIESGSNITLTVTNTDRLEAGGRAMYLFGPQGGLIGSAGHSDWVLSDRQRAVQPTHCQIRFIDNLFCLTDLCGQTYVNGASMALGRGRQARLNENDQINIGPFVIRVGIGQHEGQSVSNRQQTLETFFEQDDILQWPSEDDVEIEEDIVTPIVDDPLSALDDLQAQEQSLEDFLKPADDEEEKAQQQYLSAEDQLWQGKELTYQADNQRSDDAAIELKSAVKPVHSESKKSQSQPLKPINSPLELLNDTELTTKENVPMNSNELDELEKEIEKGMADFGDSQPNQSEQYANIYSDHTDEPSDTRHVVAGPMLKGLGVSAKDTNDMGQMSQLSEEMGAALRSAIKGLLELHKQVSDSRYGQMNRNLQPIEDNPLRLGLSYEQTVQTLFENKRSLVHLSAPSAIEESLKTIKNHNEAVQQATTEALNQIVSAFSPQVLLRRFQHYRRASEESLETDDAWAWKMYQSYYQELTSSRQHGFEKLFWEIFDQAYDRELRQKQQEF